ncbi:multidrug transporter [Streptomyces cavourensis]|jgi:multidrug efflux system outer membrane protein|uniref:multidrug efflux RND transporter outer membrane subunit OprZ n=1 Tax=unclassified Achromobacter TaxID=2626865 RepID=UPI000E07B155|nr:multidrug transporter [Streptomyces cavourensis]
MKPMAMTLLALALSGCSLAPTHERPAAPVPAQYDTPAQAGQAAPPQDWRAYFNDPALQAWIEAALANNRDLRVAALRIEEARALYGVQQSERLPAIDGSGEFSRGRTVEPGQPRMPVANRYRAAVGITAFELDFFGRVKSLSDAALSRYLASAEAHRAATLALVAETATAYFNQRSLAEQLRLTDSTLALRETTLKLTRRRYEAGLETAIGLRTAEMLVETSRATRAELTREASLARHALGLLAGDFSLAAGIDPAPLESQRLTPLAAGLPSDLLMRRPDLRQAENMLRAANADIGAARAAFFPSVQLTTDIGTTAGSFSDLFSGGTGNWTFAPRLTLPIFNAGRNRANLSLAETRQHIAVAQYEGSVQAAFRDVADALSARDALRDQIEAQRKVRDADRERQRLAERRYARGVADYLEMLEAQRSLFDSEQEYIRLQQRRLVNAVDLYKALGGWDDGRDPAS